MNFQEVEKSKAISIAQIVEYVPNSVVIKTIIKRTTGCVKIVSIDAGETLTEKISPFDCFIQVIEGAAEIIIDNTPYNVQTGEGIVVPAHSHNTIKANVRFKMLSTTIKSGYED